MTRLINTVCLALFLPLSAWAHPWPQWGGPQRNFHIELPEPLQSVAVGPQRIWQQSLGPGMSGVVGVDDVLYTMYLQPFSEGDANREESVREHREVIVAMSAESGRVRWRHDYVAGWREQQEAFGGRVRAPQATPAIVGDHLVAVGFTGLLTCLDRQRGEVVWQKDLVAKFAVPPVQFGFSASPLVLGDRVIVLAGGRRGGLICLEASTGRVVWNVPCDEASYATPVWAEFDGTRQVIFVTRQSVWGIDAGQGDLLWEYPLAEEGLTNVPTPVVVADGVIISGQGVKGTRKLKISQENQQWIVREQWYNRVQFFYCNWLVDHGRLVGCDGDLLVAVDAQTGKTLGRWRGYADSNVLGTGSSLLVLTGRGDLAVMRPRGDAIEVVDCFQAMDARCWTPPTWIDGRLYVRGDDDLVCLDWRSNDPEYPVLTRKQPPRKSLSLASRAEADLPPDPVSRIVSAIERDGVESAWELYNQLRQTTPTSLSLADRRELARMAESEGLNHLVPIMAEHAVEEFPESRLAREWLAELTETAPPATRTQTHRGDNGQFE